MSLEFFKSKIKCILFNVSSKQVGFLIIKLRSYSCMDFKCFFPLWGNGGPNWIRELRIWGKECDAEWILISPSKRRAAMGLLAMHKPPSRSSIKWEHSVKKQLSFATFHNYPVCRGYRYAATQSEIDILSKYAGYSFSAHERVIIHPLPSPDIN